MSNLQNLPPEMQARLAQIMAQANHQPESPHQAAIATPTGQVLQSQQQQPPQAPPATSVAKQPSLFDHILALRQEVNALSQQLAANSQVVEAVGQAVGELYATFQATPDPANQGGSFSQGFQSQALEDGDY